MILVIFIQSAPSPTILLVGSAYTNFYNRKTKSSGKITLDKKKLETFLIGLERLLKRLIISTEEGAVLRKRFRIKL